MRQQMGDGNTECKKRIKQLFEYAYKMATIMKIILLLV